LYRQPISVTKSGRDTTAVQDRAWTAWGVVRLLLILVALVVIVDALVGDRGLIAMRDARRQHDELAATIARQREENARLRELARRLKDDPAVIEEIARRDLGLIRPGEKVFIVKTLPPAPQP
jgi:cell division protein FtsB